MSWLHVLRQRERTVEAKEHSVCGLAFELLADYSFSRPEILGGGHSDRGSLWHERKSTSTMLAFRNGKNRYRKSNRGKPGNSYPSGALIKEYHRLKCPRLNDLVS